MGPFGYRVWHCSGRVGSSGRGTRDSGLGTRDSGLGTRDSG
ncbi:hypothetical protein [Xanthomonas translucens]|nr:hypothetical protein [Xanthomonas translucens]